MITPLTASAVTSVASVSLTMPPPRDTLSLVVADVTLGPPHGRTDTSSHPPQAVKVAWLGCVRTPIDQQEQADRRLRGRADLEQAERQSRGPLPAQGMHLGVPRQSRVEPRRERRRQRRAVHQPLVHAELLGGGGGQDDLD